jgi:hypothetical protein
MTMAFIAGPWSDPHKPRIHYLQARKGKPINAKIDLEIGVAIAIQCSCVVYNPLDRIEGPAASLNAWSLTLSLLDVIQ